MKPRFPWPYPPRRGGIKVYSATQAPTAVQREIATTLDLAMHLIEVEVPRLGGAFGGKEEQTTPWAIGHNGSVGLFAPAATSETDVKP